MDWILALLAVLWRIVRGIPGGIVAWAKRRPFEAFLVAVAIVRLFGTTVRSGQLGVLFRFGRVVRVVQPGFTWLMPGLETVRKTFSRAITMDLAPQRIATADGLVYDVSATLVYRVADPAKAMVEVADVTDGCETAVALAAYDVLGSRTRASFADRESLDEELTANAGKRLARWGLSVDRAAFTNIAATRRTLRVTQIGALVQERATALETLRGGGVPGAPAMTLLGASRVLSRSRAFRRRHGGRRGAAGAIMIERVRVKLTPDELDEAEDLFALAIANDWLSGEAEENLVAMGRRVVPFLRSRERRLGSEDQRDIVKRMIEKIEKPKKKEEVTAAAEAEE